MKHFALFIISVAATSCGKMNQVTNTETAVPRVDRQMPDLPDNVDVKMIAMSFFGDAQALGKKTAENTRSIAFVDKFADKTAEGDSTVGECIFYSDANGKVVYKDLQLLQTYWDAATYQTRKTLLYHELGHCALNLQHVPLDSGAIMEPVVLNDTFADTNWPDLVQGEFNASTLGLNLTDSADSDDLVFITLNQGE